MLTNHNCQKFNADSGPYLKVCSCLQLWISSSCLLTFSFISLSLHSSRSLCLLLLSHCPSFLSFVIYEDSVVWGKEQRCGVRDIWTQDTGLHLLYLGPWTSPSLGFISLDINREAYVEHPGYRRLFGFLPFFFYSSSVHARHDCQAGSPAVLTFSFLPHGSSHLKA